MSSVAGLAPQLQVLSALILRETRTRFGQNQLGYLWAFIEPTLWIVTFYFMFAAVQRQPPLGMSMAGFVATGLIPFSLFRESATRAMKAVDANKALLFYPQVRPLDLVIARTSLEAATLTTVLTGILTFDYLVLGSSAVADPLQVLQGLLLATALGGTLGLVLGSLSIYSTMVDRLFSPLLRPLFWLSGVFFAVDSLPAGARELLLWNPVLHVVELIRAGLSSNYAARYADALYPCVWIVVLGLLGLTLERVARRRLEVT